MDPDEALARYLQNQDKVEMEAIEADLTLAKQLQNEAVNVQNTSSSRFFLSDYALALQLEKEEKNSFAALQHDAELAKHLLDTVDESIMDEENPDIHRLFYYFNKKYFNDLLSSVEVKWSAKMTRWYAFIMLFSISPQHKKRSNHVKNLVQVLVRTRQTVNVL